MQDPLAITYPEPLNAYAKAFTEAIYLPKLKDHLHEVILAFSLYHTLFLLGPFFGSFVKSYKTLNRRTKLNFDIHIVSQVQAFLILALSFPSFFDKDLKNDTLFGYSPYAGLVYAFAAGYFAWDTYICVKYVNLFGIGFAIHGIASLIVFSLSFKPYLMYYGPIFLFFELSTPFLNVHWFAGHLPEGSIPEIVQVINGGLLLITFFFARIVWGFYWVAILAWDMWNDQSQINPIFPIVVLTSNFSLDCLNVFWFSKMISAVKKRLAAAKKGSHSSRDLLTEEEDKGIKIE
ncbi:TLC domain-containing protein [Lipomyces japonicus]|uniref:TLC domain-containing protein n=1 Tax=Lipomyces japonicus TaxID=56871 RepID=UPI0034CD518C